MKPAALVLAAILTAPVHACPPPPPAPEPPAAPKVEPMEGESSEAYRIRISPLFQEHNRQLAAFFAERDRVKAEEALRIQQWQDSRAAAQDAQFDRSRFVLLARVDSLTPRSDGKVRVRFDQEVLLKGDGRIGTLAYNAFSGQFTSCGGFEPGVDRDPDGYVIFLDTRQPPSLPGKNWIVPMREVYSARLKTLVADARAAPPRKPR